MEKLKFGIQIFLLILAFPVWFYAEMKMADKAVKTAQVKSLDNTRVKKVVIIVTAKNGIGYNLTAGFFMKQVVVNN